MERLIVGLTYHGMVQDCLKKVKYKSAWEIIGFLYQLCDFGEIDAELITCVPMWWQKERGRGFNQAEIIATLLTKTLSGVSRKDEVLERTRVTKPMFDLKKAERTKNVEGAFRINPKSKILQFSNLKIVLVDDVWTTGATMRECARILRKAGAKEVWGLTLAR